MNTEPDRDDPLRIPIDPEEALRALLHVDPDGPPVEAENDDEPPA